MYQAHFGFTQLPFHLTPNVSLFQPLSPHLEAIEMVLAGLSMNEGIMHISGEVGTGKTLVCRILMRYLPNDVDLVYLPTPALSAQELRQCVANELAVVSHSVLPTQTISELQMALIERRMIGRRVLVLVDEAQALPDEALEALRLLGNLETEQEKLLHIVLLGQPELAQRLATPQLRQLEQRVTFWAELRSLTEAEALSFISHRLQNSGAEHRLFSIRQCRFIWRASKGIPRLINQLCHKSLLVTCARRGSRVSDRDLMIAIRSTRHAVQPSWRCLGWWRWVR